MIRFLKLHVNRILEQDYAFQKQSYDHVLRGDELDGDAFQSVAWYISENPVRTGLVNAAVEYLFTGCLLPGYPELNLWAEDYWDRFWRIDASKRKW